MQPFIAMKASGGNHLESPISRFMCGPLIVAASGVLQHTTDASQGLGACWESE